MGGGVPPELIMVGRVKTVTAELPWVGLLDLLDCLKQRQPLKQSAFWQAGCLCFHWESCSYPTWRDRSGNLYHIMFTAKPAPWGMRVWDLKFILLQTHGSYNFNNSVFQPIVCDLMNFVLGDTALLGANLRKHGLEFGMNQVHVIREASIMEWHRQNVKKCC
jgi:hypothetical protein